jgi:hypothetical protein
VWLGKWPVGLVSGCCIQPIGSLPFLISWADRTTVHCVRTNTLPLSESEVHVIICKYYYHHVLNTLIFSIKIIIQWNLYRSRIHRSISMVPERILFQLWLPHLLFSRIHGFFFRPQTKTIEVSLYWYGFKI